MTIWKPIPGFPYEASDAGTIRNARTGRVLRLDTVKGGYQRVSLSVDGVVQRIFVNRLVCEAFNGPSPSASHQAMHLDGNVERNMPSNLEWGTPKQNALHRVAHGNSMPGEKNICAIHSDKTAFEVRQLYRQLKGERLRAPDGIYEKIGEQFSLDRYQVLHLVHDRYGRQPQNPRGTS